MKRQKTKAGETSPVCDWLDNPIHTGIINPDTGKEFILSGYYQDETGNRHFTHQEALEIVARTPGWELCTDEFHRLLAEAVWDDDAEEWKEDVLGSGLNGFEYLTQKLRYELGGYRSYISGALYSVGYYGYSWSSTVAASGYSAHSLNFYTQGLNPTNTNNRANGLQVRCLQVFIVQGRFFFCPALPVTRLIYNRNTGGFAGIFSICATLDGYKPATPGIVNILYRIGYSDYVNSGDYIRLYPKSGSDLHKPALRCRSALEPGIFREGARAEKTPAKT